jgi:hypothetical protein
LECAGHHRYTSITVGWPNQPLQQTAHANNGFSEFSALARVRLLLSCVDYEAVGFVKPSGSPLNVFSRRDLLTLG